MFQARRSEFWGAAYEGETAAEAVVAAGNVAPWGEFVAVTQAEMAKQSLMHHRVETVRAERALSLASGDEAEYQRGILADLRRDGAELRADAAKIGVRSLAPSDWRVGLVPPQIRCFLHLVPEAFDGASPSLRV